MKVYYAFIHGVCWITDIPYIDTKAPWATILFQGFHKYEFFRVICMALLIVLLHDIFELYISQRFIYYRGCCASTYQKGCLWLVATFVSFV